MNGFRDRSLDCSQQAPVPSIASLATFLILYQRRRHVVGLRAQQMLHDAQAGIKQTHAVRICEEGDYELREKLELVEPADGNGTLSRLHLHEVPRHLSNRRDKRLALWTGAHT